MTSAVRFVVVLFLVVSVSADPAAAVYTTIVNNGLSANRVDIVFLGDGYTTAQLSSTYGTHIQAMLNHFFNQGEDPFPRYRNFFNVHRVDVASNESGADVPPLNIFRDTALDATYYGDGSMERLLTVNNAKANAALSTALAGAGFMAEMKLVTVNDTRYGGSGGTYATYAGGNGSATEIALHELGHSFSGLADEYYYNPGTYSGSELPNANVTIHADGRKWSAWMGYVDPAHPNLGAVGTYEGASLNQYGIYRPTNNSKMRSLGQPFNAVSREKIILDIYKYVDPLDSWLANQTTLTDPTDLWVDVVDPNVIKLQWSVDGQLISGAAAEHFSVSGLVPGGHTITARAYDDTPWVRTNKENLEKSISWSVTISAPALVVWNGGSATTSNWSDGANWGGLVPGAGSQLMFAGNTRRANNNNLAASTKFASLTFQPAAGPFSLSGSAIKLSGPLTNQSAHPQTIANDVEFVGAGQVNAQSGDITLSGRISGSAGLTKSGNSQVTLTQDAAYAGDTKVLAGTLVLAGLDNSGSTTVDGILKANFLHQNSLTIYAGGKVEIASSATSVVAFLQIANAAGGFSWDASSNGIASAGVPADSSTAVPEPATWLLLALATLAALGMQQTGCVATR